MQGSKGSHINRKKSKAPENFASTTWKSLTGVVISVSNVPVNFSCANNRIVITGVAEESGHRHRSRGLSQAVHHGNQTEPHEERRGGDDDVAREGKEERAELPTQECEEYAHHSSGGRVTRM
jgi:hypothetical protein